MVTKEDITEDFLRENDGKIVWLMRSWLSMRNLRVEGKNTKEVLNKVEKLQSKMRKKGYKFKGDNL